MTDLMTPQTFLTLIGEMANHRAIEFLQKREDAIRRDERAKAKELVGATEAIRFFCDDPNGSESLESLAAGLSRLLPFLRSALAKFDSGEGSIMPIKEHYEEYIKTETQDV